MAAEGLVVTLGGGTLDADPRNDTRFCLTARGETVFVYLMRLRRWLSSCSVKNRSHANPQSAVNVD